MVVQPKILVEFGPHSQCGIGIGMGSLPARVAGSAAHCLIMMRLGAFLNAERGADERTVSTLEVEYLQPPF